jgi:hypothetical protein
MYIYGNVININRPKIETHVSWQFRNDFRCHRAVIVFRPPLLPQSDALEVRKAAETESRIEAALKI